MSGFQQVIVVGNVGRDPELKYLPSGVPVCNFTLAVNMVSGSGENRNEKTVWFRVAAWRQLAETVSQFVTKGKQIMVVGTIEARAYNDNAGQPQASLELTAQNIKFLGSRGDNGGGGGEYEQSYGEAADASISDIPF